MSSKYQKSVEQIRAPRGLIDRTKREVRLAAEKQPKAAAFPRWRTAAAAVAALAVVVCAVLFWNAGQGPVFTVLPTMEAEAPGGQLGLLDPQRRNVSAGEFDRALGTALDGLNPEDFSGWITRSPTGEAETGAASFQYRGCGVRVSKGGALLPEDLTASPAQKLSGETVYLARREADGGLLAGFLRNGVEYLVSGMGMEEEEFLSVVTGLTESLKGVRE